MMTQSHRHGVALFAALLMSFTIASASRAAEAAAPADPDNPSKAQLEQAAESVAAAAKTIIAAAKSDQQAVAKAQQSLEALRVLGQLGDFSTEAQSEKLMADLRASASPAVIDAIVQVQVTGKVAKWRQMDDAERKATLDGFVEHVKSSKISIEHLRLLQRLASMMDSTDQGKLGAEAIVALLPQMQNADSAVIKNAAASLEGVARRLDLVGKPIEMEGKLLDGTDFDWNSYRGKVVLIDFHASWCGPCRAEVPNVLKNYKAYHDKGFEVVGVNMDTDPKLAEKYQEDTGAKFPTIYNDEGDAKGWKTPLAVKYGINAIPCVILVDKDGNVVSTSARGNKLGPILTKLLGPPAEGAVEEEAEAAKSSDAKKRTPRTLTPEQRAALAERLQKALAERAAQSAK